MPIVSKPFCRFYLGEATKCWGVVQTELSVLPGEKNHYYPVCSGHSPLLQGGGYLEEPHAEQMAELLAAIKALPELLTKIERVSRMGTLDYWLEERKKFNTLTGADSRIIHVIILQRSPLESNNLFGLFTSQDSK